MAAGIYSISGRLGAATSPAPSTESAAAGSQSAIVIPAPAPVAVGALATSPAPPIPPRLTPPAPPSAAQKGVDRQRLNDLRHRVQRWLVEVLHPNFELEDAAHLRSLIEGQLDEILGQEGVSLSRLERSKLYESVAAELLAYGPIEPLLHDDTITEIMVNGPGQVWIERHGVLQETDVTFEDEAHVRRIIERIVAPIGRRIDESSPMVDARLPDGSRVNAIIPPLSLVGPVLTIRKFSHERLNIQNLIEFGTLTPEAAEFLACCVKGRANVLVSGGTGSGKTTLLNILSSFIPDNERIITIEDAAELRLHQRHVISLEVRPPNAEGMGAVTIGQLLVNSLRMRPDRIVVGECRSAEALDMLQAMNTGHDGSMTTLHANSPRDALSRLETMVLMAGKELPYRAIREQIASAIHIVVQQERLQDGSRRVTEISEVQGMEGDVIVMSPVYRFHRAGFDGKWVLGRLTPATPRPKIADKLGAHNVTLSPSLFQQPAA